MTTVHDAIVDHALQLLRLPAPVCDGPIEEELDLDDLGESIADAVSIDLPASEADDSRFAQGSVMDWTSNLTIQCAARDDSRNAGASAGRASRNLHALVHARLMADPSFGDRLEYFAIRSLRTEGRDLNHRLGRCTAVYELKHRSAQTTLEA